VSEASNNIRVPMNTTSWIAILVSVIVFSVGLVLNVDARRVNERWANDHALLNTIIAKDTNRDNKITQNSVQIATLIEIARDNASHLDRLENIISKREGP
jgi:signal transduction histidine kinase